MNRDERYPRDMGEGLTAEGTEFTEMHSVSRCQSGATAGTFRKRDRDRLYT